MPYVLSLVVIIAHSCCSTANSQDGSQRPDTAPSPFTPHSLGDPIGRVFGVAGYQVSMMYSTVGVVL